MPVTGEETDGEQDLSGRGMEEFAGLRDYQPGDSWRRVSWKATARSDRLHTKEFTGGAPETQWIDWLQIAASGTEDRLSRMVRLVIDAEDAHRLYGLRLPDREVPPGHGSRHYQNCLRTLALYGS
jgi:uncharacterized protein (DUF58 family)